MRPGQREPSESEGQMLFQLWSPSSTLSPSAPQMLVLARGRSLSPQIFELQAGQEEHRDGLEKSLKALKHKAKATLF